MDMLAKAEGLFKREEFEELEGLLADILARWPDATTAEILSAQCAMAAKRYDQAGDRWNAVIAKYPDHADARREYVRFLGATRNHEELERYVATIAAPIAAAEARLEFFLAMDDYRAAMEQAAYLAQQKPDPAFRLRHARILMREGFEAAQHAALWTLRELYEMSPDSIVIRQNLAEALIGARDYDWAKELVASLPAGDKRVEVEVLRAWSNHTEGDEDAAKERWKEITSHQYFPALHARIRTLERIDDHGGEVRPGEILLLSVLRNEVARIKWFLDYYRKLGVNRFVIIDNASDDGTENILAKEPDVILYRTPDSYDAAGAGMRWINELVGQHGKQNWCLCVDVNEALVFPLYESLGLRGLIDYLVWKGHEAMSVTVLDLYPAAALDAEKSTGGETQWSNLSFDNQFYSRGHPICPYEETFGGAGRRIASDYGPISKIALINGSAGIRFLLGSHHITSARMSDVTGALLRHRLGQSLRNGGGSSEPFLFKDSVHFDSSEQLLELGICRAPEFFLKVGRATRTKKD